jgi:hypothetical protein
VFDPSGNSEKEIFLQSYPTFTEICDIEFIAIKENTLLKSENLNSYLDNKDAISTILLLYDNPIQNLKQAKKIKPLIPKNIPIFIRMHDESIISQALQGKENDFFPLNFECFGLPNQTNSLELIIEEKLDQMAQAIHTDYLEKNRPEVEYKASKVPWKLLSEDYKDANRQAADHIDVKLRAIDCEATASSKKQPATELTPEEIEILAKMEHNRWKAERLLKGWTYDLTLDDEKKKHPCLVSWEQLSEDEKEKDRQQVRDIPNILEKVDLKIVRSN